MHPSRTTSLLRSCRVVSRKEGEADPGLGDVADGCEMMQNPGDVARSTADAYRIPPDQNVPDRHPESISRFCFSRDRIVKL